MNSTPSEVGAAAEREVACALARAGYTVFVPFFTPHSRIDLVAERDGHLERIQVKSARVIGNSVVFHTCSNTGNVSQAYHGEVDAFGVHAPQLGASYLVPISGLPSRGCYLRLSPPKNNQQKGIRWARDYLIT